MLAAATSYSGWPTMPAPHPRDARSRDTLLRHPKAAFPLLRSGNTPNPPGVWALPRAAGALTPLTGIVTRRLASSHPCLFWISTWRSSPIPPVAGGPTFSSFPAPDLLLARANSQTEPWCLAAPRGRQAVAHLKLWSSTIPLTTASLHTMFRQLPPASVRGTSPSVLSAPGKSAASRPEIESASHPFHLHSHGHPSARAGARSPKLLRSVSALASELSFVRHAVESACR